MNLGFIILAHHQPDLIRRQVDLLAADGNKVVIHFDTSATKSDREAVAAMAAAKPGRVTVISKEHCVWGEWSLVEAVLQALAEFAKSENPPDYIHLMSGADFSIRPLVEMKEFLAANPDKDFIECCDITKKAWVKGGLGSERLRFYYLFNFRTSRRAFNRMVRWQRKLKIRRKMPLDLRPHMGSQWWTMRWTTCKKVLDFTRGNPEVPKFFRSTWIPDESYFQTIVAKTIPRGQIADQQLLFHHLMPAGRPYVFYNDHVGLVRRIPHFFIRKVSPDAKLLQEEIQRLNVSRGKIPSLRLLAKTRDLLRSKIDGNHLFTVGIPGYYQDKVQSVLKTGGADEIAAAKARKVTPADGATRPVPVARPEITRGVVILFPEDVSQVAEIERIVGSIPGLCWLGTPFSNGMIRVPVEHLARMGLTEKSHAVRDAFNRQFSRFLVEATPPGLLPVMVVLAADSKPGLEVFERVEALMPVLVTNGSTMPHQVSRMKTDLFVLSARIAARTVEVRLEKLPDMFEGLLADRFFTKH